MAQADGNNHFLASFKVDSMNMKDGDTGKVLWTSEGWGSEVFEKEVSITVPQSILKCKVVSREIAFSSAAAIKDFNLVQHIFLKDMLIETWKFRFGFVIPGSTNSWDNIIEAADEADMIPAPILNGNIVIVTTFYDGETEIGQCRVRVFYE